MSGSKPFQQLAFARLPERPRRAHGFFELPQRAVEVSSKPFGRVRVTYREAGAGAPLLLVHGLMTSSYSFRYVIEPLARTRRAIAIDLPGAGDSDKPEARYGARDLATFIAETMRALGIEGCDVVGNSLGGYLSMWCALDHPGAIGRLVNLHSPASPMWRLHALRIALSTPGADRVLDAMIRRDPLRWVHRNVHYYDESLKSLEEAREYGRPLATPEGRRAFTRYLSQSLDPSSMADFVATLRARAFPIPLALVYARRDPMVPPDNGKRLAALVPDAHMVWLDECSHFMHVDRPDLVVETIASFFGSSAAAPTRGGETEAQHAQRDPGAV